MPCQDIFRSIILIKNQTTYGCSYELGTHYSLIGEKRINNSILNKILLAF
jgi:hypothetical protein